MFLNEKFFSKSLNKLQWSFQNNSRYIYKFLFRKIEFDKKLKCSITKGIATENYFSDGNMQNLNQERSHPASIFGRKHIGNVEIPSEIIKSVRNIITNSKSNIHSSTIKMYTLRNSQDVKNKFLDINTYFYETMPHVYASLYSIIYELKKRFGDKWVPETVLDCGAGPGIGALVFQELFSDSIEKVKNIVVIETMRAMKKCALYIHRDNKSKIVSSISSAIDPKFDFIIANHTILNTNAPNYVFSAYIKKLWTKLSPRKGILLLLEKGNPAGYESVAKARQAILSGFNFSLDKDIESMEIGHVISPCSHDKKCPLLIDGQLSNHKGWCHFSQNLVKPDYLRETKRSTYNIESTKYSYCVIQKGISRPTFQELNDNLDKDNLFYSSYSWPRLILPPLKKRGHVIMDACISNGTIQRLIIPKSQGRLAYRDARKAHWGDLWALGSKFFLKKNINV
ncbi:hypothetical protein PORY_000757 [Pneumocystis oryctolagi]|uniref:Uncharacterized protein n=1 Tax=Pneumocystis oryctolagi TaxID=42067 RepID=A0ACB7CGQ7_9ASCO|nr:hypothetical protein PORY_000757 [Pneumocystis oryctolagi]